MMNKKQAEHAFDTGLSKLEFTWKNQHQVFAAVKGRRVRKKLSLGVAFAIVLVLAATATAAVATSVLAAYYERVGFVNHSAYDKWSVWVGGDTLLSVLDRIDAIVDQLSDGLYEENLIMDATAKVNPKVNATEKKALRTALYSFWNVADPDFFSLDTFEPSSYKASVVYEEDSGNSDGEWHVRLNPNASGLPYYYAEIGAMDNQLIRIHKLSEDGTKTLKIVYFGAIEWDYDEFLAMGQAG